MKTLKQAKIGETVKVVKLHGEGALKRRIMIGTLHGFGLVTMEKYGTVHLTETGREKAAWYADCLDLLLSQFEDALGPSGIDYRNAACTVLAETPESILRDLRQRLKGELR